MLILAHMNFIVQEVPTEEEVKQRKEKEHTVITVAMAPILPSGFVHNALLTSKKVIGISLPIVNIVINIHCLQGYHMMEVKVSPGPADTLAERIDTAVSHLEKSSIVGQPLDAAGFSKAFATLETKHPQVESIAAFVFAFTCR